MRRHRVALGLAIAGGLWLWLGGCRSTAPQSLVLATTTSVGNSGLLDTLTERFLADTGIAVRPQLVGSGLALRMLDEKHVDVVVSHAPAAEATALAAHPGWRYRKIMWNTFVIVGPPTDPAHVSTTRDLTDAMRRIATSGQTFLSRGDRSGTHEREEALWARAGVRPQPHRLVVAGSGMGTTLRAASGTAAYTLTDAATFAQLAPNLALKIVFEGDPFLLNTYAVIYDPDGEKSRSAAAFADWLSEGEGRLAVERFRVSGGIVAFTVWPLDRPRTHPDDTPGEITRVP